MSEPIIVTRRMPPLFPKSRWKPTAWERLLRGWSAGRLRKLREKRNDLRDELRDTKRMLTSLLQIEQAKSSQLQSAVTELSTENARLKKRIAELEAKCEVNDILIETQDMVIRRDRERVNAETARWLKLQAGASVDSPTAVEQGGDLEAG